MYDVSVRNASFSDMDSLCELFCYLFQQQHLGEPQLFRLPILDDEVERARLVRYIRSILEQPEHVLLVAMRADECIGFAHVVLRSSPESSTVPFRHARCEAWLQHIAVLPEFQGAGVGMSLAKASNHWAKNKGATALGLQVWGFNQKAARFFEKLGFQMRTTQYVKSFLPME